MGASAADRGDAERETPLDPLVLEWLSRIEREGDEALESLAREHPEHAATLRRRVGLLREAGLLGRASSEHERIPEELGDFRLVRRLGGGGMGVVYLAEQRSLGRRVALKLIRPEHMYFPGARARFAREAQTIARLAHPGIVPIHAVGEANGIPYLAMEFVAGASLAALLARWSERAPDELDGAALLAAVAELSGVEPIASDRTSMPFAGSWMEACVWIAREVAQALEHAHQRGVVHRDVKPSNVMLTTSGRVLLVDFGLASAEGADAVTKSGSAVGSLPYMAPEQVRGESERIGARTDLYGLGVLLFELVSLRRPFESADAGELRARILAARPKPLRALAQSTPRDLETLVRIAIEPELERRYASAADLARDLTHVLQREPIEARPTGAWVQLLRWTQRHPAAAALTLLVLVVGPSVFAWQQWRAGARIRAERDRADANFAHALDAVDQMLAQVGSETLLEVPQMEGVRRELLEAALDFYGRFLEPASDAPEVKLRGAITRRRVGRIRRELGQNAEAEVVLAAAEQTLRELERSAPDDASVREELTLLLRERATALEKLARPAESEALLRELLERSERAAEQLPDQASEHAMRQVDTRLALAYLARDRGLREEALELAERAVEDGRKLLEGEPDDLGALWRVGRALQVCAELMVGRHSDEDVAERFLEATDVLRRASAADPESRNKREQLARALGRMGGFLGQAWQERDFTWAGASMRETLRECVATFGELARDYPRIVTYQASLAAHSSNLCAVLTEEGEFDEARALGEQAVAAARALVALEPERTRHQGTLGSALNNLARVHTRRSEPERALELSEQAIAAQQLAIAGDPENEEFRLHLVRMRVVQGAAAMHAGRWREGSDSARAVADSSSGDFMITVSAAELLGMCAAVAERDPELADDARARAVAELLAEAAELFRSALGSGYSVEQLRAFLDEHGPTAEHPALRALLDG